MMRQLLIKTARVLADTASPWNVQNIDCYPRVRLLFEILAAFGCDAEQIKREMVERGGWVESRRYLAEQIDAIETIPPDFREDRINN